MNLRRWLTNPIVIAALVEFVITIAMFIPWTRRNLSGFSSGNTSCSARPKL